MRWTETRGCAEVEKFTAKHGGSTLAVLGALSLIPYGVFAVEKSTRNGILCHEVAFAAAFVLFAVAVVIAVLLPTERRGRGLLIVIAFSILYRGMAVPNEPPRTTDPYRYIWEGKMTNLGINPFIYPPDHPDLVGYRDDLWWDINNKSVPTVYATVSQFVFHVAYRLKPNSMATLKALFALIDVATIFALCGLLGALGRSRMWSIVYAWHPLVVTEISLNGHQDGIGIFFLALTCYFFARRLPLGCGLALALSVMAKGYSLLAVPLLFLGFLRLPRRASGAPDSPQEPSPRRQSVTFLVSLTLTLVVLALPFFSPNMQCATGLRQYLENWERNAGIYYVVRKAASPLDDMMAPIIDHLGIASRENVSDMDTPSSPVAKGVCLALFITAFGLSMRCLSGDTESTLSRVFFVFAAFFMLSSTVYPWYICWSIPFLCVRFSPSWFLFSGLVAMNYLYRWFGGEPDWIRFSQYLPVWIGLLAEWRMSGQEC
ncbi:MAG: hypothetical protein AUJ92_12885 [Armatimonadetes bacterium CG2_30_59_28]|nr:hypothetical protein [Armatimonadota bacterium]OIO93160.1 MAG: hypothetical protein AUJ92_12885 [Armatimonadetes bacterium CG2_30_59_28]PIU62260.1 MAG: hypothetical protein COS85_19025 [Armatimonadetes bacterium CG07_land_8_20_14_0_80_59_28]PIX37956.1 MAG: hypothetical protein COZ56_21805 [Armatimonadetes bacterium CG_4_8_14_3_um_filter_58_9]PIY48065.1 MAG: hypothetical protein COZ05_04250 [Armatimonadetes bacterium CG_4_10_14_3_um_filter_59_10]PJB73315.1 MAG: hypothetical protein CO095_059